VWQEQPKWDAILAPVINASSGFFPAFSHEDRGIFLI